MGNRIFQAVVLLMWASAMTWLMVAKILPTFFRGNPPPTGVLEQANPVGWRIDLAGERCGVAVSQALPGVSDTTEFHSRVQLDSLPLPQQAPRWMFGLLKKLGDVRLDLRNRAIFDTLGSLASFETRARVNDLDPVVKITGLVRDGRLKLKLQTGQYVQSSELPWRERSMLGGQLSPTPKILDLYVGRRWREEVFSPFAAVGSPAQLVEAQVEEEETLPLDGKLVRVKRIVYRSVSAAGVASEDSLRAVVWVAEDGQVLRQDSYVMNVCLRFTRMPPAASAALANALLDLDIHAATTTPKALRSGRIEPGAEPAALTPPAADD